MNDWIDELSAEIEDFDGKPIEVWLRTLHVGLEVINSRINAKTKVERDQVLRLDFAAFLSDLGEELGLALPNLRPSFSGDEKIAALIKFSMETRSAALKTKISGKANSTFSAKQVSKRIAQQITPLVEQLRTEISGTNFPKKRHDLLMSKLDNFERELSKPSPTVGLILPALAIIGASLAGSVSVLADGPAAIETLGKITALIGFDGLNEEEIKQIDTDQEPLRLPSPNETLNQ